MQPTSAPFVTAADALHQISSRSQGERRRHASAGALVLGVVEQALSNNGDLHSFSLARADREVEALAPSADRSILRRMLLAVTGDPVSLPQLAAELLRYASKLESTQRIAEADAALALARAVVPRDSAAALHAGRVARKLGERARALELYRAARTLDGEDGGIARFA
ncbi:MAG: hypothetical protein M3418_01780, partial [Gemmatimonadota bacterium]|nr:hypothetical protein [Gemmatimonadota bacterium]